MSLSSSTDSVTSNLSSSSITSFSSSSSSEDQSIHFDDVFDLSVFLHGGRFGAYYRCVERETSRKYMVKILKPVDTKNRLHQNNNITRHVVVKQGTFSKRVNTFSREGVVWRRLKHRNIIELLRMFKSSTEQFLVLEYIKDGGLFEQLQQYTTYTERDVRYFGKQLFEALQYLQKRRVIHRALMPQNILLKNNDVIKICGFDLCIRLEKHQKFASLEPEGVPLYVAPEILQGKPVNYAVDLWSIGVILHILLLGFPPFWSEKKKQLYAAILTRDILTVISSDKPSWEGVSKTAQDLVLGLLSKTPEKRMTPDDALKHDWFWKDDYVQRRNKKFALQKLKEFHENSGKPVTSGEGSVHTMQKIFADQKENNSDLISSSFGEKRRIKMYEQSRQLIANDSVIARPPKITVVSQKSIQINKNIKGGKVFIKVSDNLKAA